MKKTKTIKRILVKEIRRPDVSICGDGTKQTDDPNCNGTPFVYCNR